MPSAFTLGWKDNRNGHAGRGTTTSSSEATRTGTRSTWPCSTPAPAGVHAHRGRHGRRRRVSTDARAGPASTLPAGGSGRWRAPAASPPAWSCSSPRPVKTVVEVGALKRARGAKNDRIDAIRAARQALARDEQSAPRAGGLREALRMVFACREGVLVSRTKAINELKSLIVVAPEQLRAAAARPFPGRPARLGSSSCRPCRARHPSSSACRCSACSPSPPGSGSCPRQLAELDPAAARADQAAPGRAGAARRARRRPGRRRAAADQLVPPRPGPQRSRVRLPGRRRTRSKPAAANAPGTASTAAATAP